MNFRRLANLVFHRLVVFVSAQVPPVGPAENGDPQPQTSSGGAKRENDDKVDVTRIFFFFPDLTHARGR